VLQVHTSNFKKCYENGFLVRSLSATMCGKSHRSKEGKVTLFFGLILSFCFGIVLWDCNLARKSKNWPMVTGEVVSNSLKREVIVFTNEYVERKDWWSYVKYRYSVLGHTYTNDRIVFGGKLPHRNREEAKIFAEKYQVGSTLKVFYDPRNPQSSVLERRVGGHTYLYAIALLIVYPLYLLFVYFW